jgi:hypothetical protein
MIRTLILLIMYVLCLGIVSFEVTFRDGLRVNLYGWPYLIARYLGNSPEEIDHGINYQSF